MKMTWWVWEDHLYRIAPFLQKLRAGKSIDADDLAALNNPLKPKPFYG